MRRLIESLDECLGEASAIAVDECDGVFLSVDVDVCDPGHAPGTGTPEPGGLTARQLLDCVRRIAYELPLAGIDVVELCPPHDHAEITSFLADRVVLEALSGIAPPPGRARRHHLGSPPAVARPPPGHRLRRRRYPPKPSNSPLRTPPRKARHSSDVNLRTGPDEFLLLRTPISPPGRLATSTQLPLA
jgi:Arginase family